MPARRTGIVVEVEGYGPASILELAKKVFPEMKRSDRFFRYRWQLAGQPGKVSRELFESKKPQRHENAPAPKVKRSIPQEKRYADRHYLPEVPWGDLAHLSGDRNTGAARQVSS